MAVSSLCPALTLFPFRMQASFPDAQTLVLSGLTGTAQSFSSPGRTAIYPIEACSFLPIATSRHVQEPATIPNRWGVLLPVYVHTIHTFLQLSATSLQVQPPWRCRAHGVPPMTRNPMAAAGLRERHGRRAVRGQRGQLDGHPDSGAARRGQRQRHRPAGVPVGAQVLGGRLQREHHQQRGAHRLLRVHQQHQQRPHAGARPPHI